VIALRRLSVTAVVVTYLQLTLGGIVRISGSGMGCGDNWPKCNGSWIPPFTNPTVMIEWTHRLMALLVVLTVASLAVLSRRAAHSGGADERRVRNSAVLAFVLVVAVALLGMVTVRLGNTALATVAHWTLAMALLGVSVAAAMRSGALGGATARAQGGSARSARSLGAGAAIAFVVVVLGGLVAKSAGAASACPGFPLCGETPPGVGVSMVYLQMTHRALAFLLTFHAIAIATVVGRRQGEAEATRTAATLAAVLVVAQVSFGAALIMGGMQPLLRGAHEAAGVAVWMVLFGAAYLARTASRAA
jgi:heme A synthase